MTQVSFIRYNGTRKTLMNIKSNLFSGIAFGLITTSALSQEVPRAGFYAGIGASANAVQYQSQSVYALGISNVYSPSGALISQGTADGPPVNVNLPTVYNFSPTLQAGYFDHFQDSAWLWGVKFTYSYTNAQSTSDRFLIPQYGSFGTTPFTGNAVVGSYKVNVKQQMSLIPYVGHDYGRGYFYAGIGPTVTQLDSSVNNVIGFADIVGTRTDISGQPQSFSQSQWVVGGAAMVGVTYYFDKSWFLDLNYTYAMTPSNTANYNGTFYNPDPNRTYSGSLIGNSKGTTSTQSITLLLSKTF